MGREVERVGKEGRDVSHCVCASVSLAVSGLFWVVRSDVDGRREDDDGGEEDWWEGGNGHGEKETVRDRKGYMSGMGTYRSLPI
jgi:hypothetical protein